MVAPPLEREQPAAGPIEAELRAIAPEPFRHRRQVRRVREAWAAAPLSHAVDGYTIELYRSPTQREWVNPAGVVKRRLVVDVQVTEPGGTLIYDDRLNLVGPAAPILVEDGTFRRQRLYARNGEEIAVRKSGLWLSAAERAALAPAKRAALRDKGEEQLEPNKREDAIEGVLREVLRAALAVTKGGAEPHLMGNGDGTFRGDTTVVTAESNDDSLYSGDSVWATARDGAGSISIGGTSILVGDDDDSPGYNVGQFCLEFDTSAIDDAHVVSGTVMAFNVRTRYIQNEFVMDCFTLASFVTVATSMFQDEAELDALTELATIDSTGGAASGYYNMVEVGTELSDLIVLNGSTFLMLASHNAHVGTGGASPESGDEEYRLWGAGEAGKEPKLTITHAAGATAHSGAAALAGGVSVTAAGLRGALGSAALSGSATLASTGLRGALAMASLSARAAVAAMGALAAAARAALSAVGTLAALATVGAPATTGSVALSETAIGGVSLSENVVGAAALSEITLGAVSMSEEPAA